MELRILLAFIAIFGLSRSEPLSKRENENRLRTCGSIVQKKVLSGITAKQSDAPWSVALKPNGQSGCTGTLVSSRHVLTASHCFAIGIEDNGWKRVQKNKGQCRDGHYFMDKVPEDRQSLDNYMIHSDNKSVVGIKRAIFLNGCLEKKLSGALSSPGLVYEDFAILELKHDVQFTDTLQPACVAAPGPKVPVGVDLHYFGYGWNPETGGVGSLLYEKTQSIPLKLPLDDYFFMSLDPDRIRMTCPGDSGGGAMSTDGDKITLIGVLSQTNCQAYVTGSKVDPVEIFSSVAYYSKHLCTFAGICSDGSIVTKNDKEKMSKEMELEMAEMAKREKSHSGWNLPFFAMSIIALMLY